MPILSSLIVHEAQVSQRVKKLIIAQDEDKTRKPAHGSVGPTIAESGLRSSGVVKGRESHSVMGQAAKRMVYAMEKSRKVVTEPQSAKNDRASSGGRLSENVKARIQSAVLKEARSIISPAAAAAYGTDFDHFD